MFSSEWTGSPSNRAEIYQGLLGQAVIDNDVDSAEKWLGMIDSCRGYADWQQWRRF